MANEVKRGSGGGLVMPKNPARELQELMLQQMEEPASTETDAHLRIPASAQVLEQAREDALTQGSDEASARSIKEVSNPAIASSREHVSKPSRRQSRKEESEQKSIEVTVREALLARRNHPGGIKASVDMSPELSLRVKRFCLDNGSISSRLLFLELVTAFLDQEGY